jgi:hypothetical protein
MMISGRSAAWWGVTVAAKSRIRIYGFNGKKCPGRVKSSLSQFSIRPFPAGKAGNSRKSSEDFQEYETPRSNGTKFACYLLNARSMET